MKIYNYHGEDKSLYELTLNDLLELINNTNSIFMNACIEPSVIVQYKEDNIYNPYHILIQFLKFNAFNNLTGTYFKTSYYDSLSNRLISINSLYLRILETMQKYDQSYLEAFITIHFYGLIYDNIINDKLKNEWSWVRGRYSNSNLY